MNMRKIFPFLALMITLAGPLAYADENNKAASTNNSQPAAQSYPQSSNNEQGPCSAKDQKHDKQKTKSAPTNQEKEFDRVLMGIWG